MRRQDFRAEFNGFRRIVEEEATSRRDPYHALERLHQFYERLNAEQRAAADETIATWLGSSVEAQRFDALVLIEDYGIRSAVPALQELLVSLRSIPGPAAAFESQKVERILARLGRHSR
jgi:hypothetical protein